MMARNIFPLPQNKQEPARIVKRYFVLCSVVLFASIRLLATAKFLTNALFGSFEKKSAHLCHFHASLELVPFGRHLNANDFQILALTTS